MNKRIKKLKEQATSYTWNGNDVTEELDEQKFAELIVRECVEQIIIRERADGEWYQDDIFKHFGVEEHAVCNHDWYSARNPVVKNGSVCVKCGAIDSREPEELKNERTN